MPHKKPLIIAAVFVFLATLGGVLYKNYLDNTYEIKVSYEHVNDVQIVEKGKNSPDRAVGRVKSSGDTVRISRSNEHSISYKGDKDYQDGSMPVNPELTAITIKPEFSDAKYQQLARDAAPQVTQLLTQKYPAVTELYDITPSKMFDYGQWYLVQLKYKAAYDQNADNLQVLFKKDGDKWVLASKPLIILTTTNTPNVPAEILQRASQVPNNISADQLNRS